MPLWLLSCIAMFSVLLNFAMFSVLLNFVFFHPKLLGWSLCLLTCCYFHAFFFFLSCAIFMLFFSSSPALTFPVYFYKSGIFVSLRFLCHIAVELSESCYLEVWQMFVFFRLVLMSATADIARYRDYFKDLGRGERVEVLAIANTNQHALFQRRVSYLEQASICI